MGEQINPVSYRAFVEELSKEASIAALVGKISGPAAQARIAGNLRRAGEAGAELYKRLRHPIAYGLPQGWKAMTPSSGVGGHLGAVRRQARLQAAGHAGKASPFSAASGQHLLDKGTTLREAMSGQKGPRIKALAEELSRRGWTGKSRALKYLPVGEKGMVAAFPMTSIPTMVNAPKPTRTGEGGAIETGAGEALGSAGWVLGTGLGGPAGLATAIGGSMLGSRLGRVADRLRAGASAREALTAPSPTQARKQLETIQHYYG